MRVVGAPGRVEDDEDVVLVDVDLRPLAELARVLLRHRVQPERPADALELVRRGRAEVEPEELVTRQLGGDLAVVDLCQDLQGRKRNVAEGEQRRRSTLAWQAKPFSWCAKPNHYGRGRPLASNR